MKIGGLQKISFIDYPGRIGAVVFVQGCNFRCPYCHNPELVDPARYGPLLDEGAVLSFLEKRRGKLDAVTLTGGEPTLQPDLADFLRQIRGMGYLIKLDTNGSHPEVIATLIREKLVDCLAMDIKGPREKYARIARAEVDLAAIDRSIDGITESGLEHEFRTTVVPSQITMDDLLSIAEWLKNARRYVLQSFVPPKTLDPAFLSEPPCSPEELAAMRERLQRGDLRIEVR
jgi:pyruvate formate lyase activating enzyme